jgi:endonuclease YncB( thermonuclease family)
MLLKILSLLFGPAPRPRKTIRRAERTVTRPAAPRTAPTTPPQTSPRTLRGKCHVIDGDTIVIDRVHIRLAGIDAPELDHPWGKKAKWAMATLCKGQVVTAEVTPELSCDRVVALCFLPDGRDLSAEMVRLGLALDWKRFSGGRYRHLEPEGVRKKLWRCDARQKGRMPPAR